MNVKKFNTFDAIKRMRRSWNGLNPVTKIIPDKKRQKNKKLCRKKVNIE